MAGVQQPQLHQLVRHNVGHHLDADLLQRRAPSGEVIFQRPLRERLTHHRPRVLDVEAFPDLHSVFICGDGSDSVHHGVRESDVAGHPFTQLRISEPGKRGEDFLRHMTVALDVVAGHHREGLDATRAPAHQGLCYQAERGGRDCTRSQICLDSRIRVIEFAGDADGSCIPLR